MDLGFQDATAVVVGGGRGVGFATARCLATDGARVAVVGRTPAVLDRAAEELTRLGSPDAVGLVADVCDAERVETLFAEVGQRGDGELNVLVNAVGPSAVGSFEDLTDEEWLEAVPDGVVGVGRRGRGAPPSSSQAARAR